MADHKHLKTGASRTLLDGFAGNGDPKLTKIDFNCLTGKYPVTLKKINIFDQANEHLKIGFTVLQYNTEFEGGESIDKIWYYI